VAERRAQALTLDRHMLAELLGADELRELLDADVLDALEAELQALEERRWAQSVDAAGDLLRRLGDLSVAELRARSTADFSGDLVRERRAIVVRIAGEERLILAEDAGRYRDALGVAIPGGVPEAFLEPVDDALEQLVRRWGRVHGPFVSAQPAARFGVDVGRVDEVLSRLEGRETVVRGAFRPAEYLAERGLGLEREWCDNEVLRMLRQRSLAALRREVEPVETDVLARFLPAWHGVGSDARGLDRLYEVVAQLQGVAIPASVLERDVLSARVRDYSSRLLDELCAAGEIVWVGAGPIGKDDGRVLLHLRGSPLARSAPVLAADSPDRPSDDEHDRLRALLAGGGARFFRDLTVTAVDERVTLESLWDLVWAGEVTNDAFAPVRALSVKKRTSGTGRRGGAGARGRPRLGTLTTMGPPTAQGRWSLVDRSDVEPTVAAHALAGALLERHGVLTREAVRGEGTIGGYAAVYPVLRAMEDAGRIRRGYFVAGLGGAQFALPGAVDRLRQYRDTGLEVRAVVLAATDPANPFGVALPWPEVVGEVGGRPARTAGSYVVLLDGVASLYVERRVKGLIALRPFDGTWEPEAIAAIEDARLVPGRYSRVVIEKSDVELHRYLKEAEFIPTPKGWSRYR
jgi:ATP-dependent Lhr-like helicase